MWFKDPSDHPNHGKISEIEGVAQNVGIAWESVTFSFFIVLVHLSPLKTLCICTSVTS